VVTNAPAQLEDIAPTVLTDMGVKPTGMYGHIADRRASAILHCPAARE
jgi:arylsulfatase A-like enzyme